MFSSDSVKFFILSAFLFCPACGVWQSAKNVNSAPHVTEEIKTGIPFENKEPEAFQTEIVVTSYTNGEKSEKKYFLARNGAQRLTIFNRGEPNEASVLQTRDGKTFFLDGGKKTFRENQNPVGQGSGELNEFLTTEWLNQKTDAAFENLGTENNLTKYLVRLAGSNASEIFIYEDENLKIPVKQEFYSVSGEQKTLFFSVELKNFQTSADENLFKLPQDYKRVEAK